MAETVASISEPEAAKAGRRAVTITAATFLVFRVWAASRTLTPSRSSMADRLCLVKAAFCSESPVPLSPTTMP